MWIRVREKKFEFGWDFDPSKEIVGYPYPNKIKGSECYLLSERKNKFEFTIAEPVLCESNPRLD